MSKNIVICMDGTWNDPTEKTNVYKLFRSLNADPENVVQDHPTYGRYSYRKGDGLEAYYIEGVGAKGRSQGILGGALGIGLHERVLHAYLLASSTYQRGDKFWIFGFSRGAWSARSLAGFISTAGLLTKEEVKADDSVIKANKIWLQTKTKGTLDRSNNFWDANDSTPIHLVGVWDTVGALGIPFFNGIRAFDQVEKHLFDFADLRLSNRVKYGRHALAVDERRKDFEPSLWHSREDGSIKQIWFPGVHADVGGGYPEAGLSDIALQWMIDEVNSLNTKLKLDSSQLAPELSPDEEQNRHDEAEKAIWKLRPRQPRAIATDADLHDRVVLRIKKRADYRPVALRNHPKVTGLFDGVATQEDIFTGGETLPSKRLELNDNIKEDIFAQNCWNATHIEVKKGERYEISATGKWTDKTYQADAAGYASPNILLKSFESVRRIEDKPWFCLIACVHPEAILEAHNPSAGNMLTGAIQSLTHKIGKFDKESQLVGIGESGTITVDQDGYLYLFANDAPFAYSNNNGYLTVSVTRTS